VTLSYLAFWTLGASVGFLAGLLVLHVRRALRPTTVFALGLAWGGMLVGAKLQYRLEHFPPLSALWFSLGDVLDPGMRIPMGLLTGGLLAGLWCVAVRAPWRETGDALAVAASTLIPIGRIGCLTNGCCMGGPCPSWLPFCPRYTPGSEAYNAQLRDNLITLSSPLSLPAHPLPVYFAVGSLLTLAVLVWLLRRGARPGTLLAVFMVVRPLTKIALETLRAEPRPPLLMLGIPTFELTAAVVVLGILYARRLGGHGSARDVGRAKPAAVAVLALAVGLGSLSTPVAPPAWGQQGLPAGTASAAAELDSRWQKALGTYLQDPRRGRRELRRLARHGTDGLPPFVLLALADAEMRANHGRKARRLFEAVIDTQPGEPWNSWSELALGAMALRSGDVDEARAHYESAAGAGTATAPLAMLLGAMVEVQDGDPAKAIIAFRRVASMQEASPPVREAARIGAAYAQYWSGDFAGAAAAFQAVADANPGGPLADDGRYGAAWSRHRAGDDAGALPALRTLAAEASGRGRRQPISNALIDLEPKAVMKVGVTNSRKGPVAMPDQAAVQSIDLDGVALARAAIRFVEKGGPRNPSVPAAAPLGTDLRETWAARGGVPGTAAPGATDTDGARDGVRGSGRGDPVVGGFAWKVVLGGLAVVLIAWAMIAGRGRASRARRI
jgi:prolipoprotein diacylglyceryltransferase/tetratricopeptide (TPR) repeat protein